MGFWRPHSPLSGLPYLKPGRSGRSSSYDRTGGNRDFAVVAPGESHVLADLDGTGVIQHIWLTTRCYSEKYLRKLVLEMYWDGSPQASVRSPLGDFFGVGTCLSRALCLVATKHGLRTTSGPQGTVRCCHEQLLPNALSHGSQAPAPERE